MRSRWEFLICCRWIFQSAMNGGWFKEHGSFLAVIFFHLSPLAFLRRIVSTRLWIMNLCKLNIQMRTECVDSLSGWILHLIAERLLNLANDVLSNFKFFTIFKNFVAVDDVGKKRFRSGFSIGRFQQLGRHRHCQISVVAEGTRSFAFQRVSRRRNRGNFFHFNFQ